jgi:hypothetical protein
MRCETFSVTDFSVVHIRNTASFSYGSQHDTILKSIVLRVEVAQWLRHCGTNRKVAGSIPKGFTGIFH